MRSGSESDIYEEVYSEDQGGDPKEPSIMEKVLASATLKKIKKLVREEFPPQVYLGKTPDRLATRKDASAKFQRQWDQLISDLTNEIGGDAKKRRRDICRALSAEGAHQIVQRLLFAEKLKQHFPKLWRCFTAARLSETAILNWIGFIRRSTPPLWSRLSSSPTISYGDLKLRTSHSTAGVARIDAILANYCHTTPPPEDGAEGTLSFPRLRIALAQVVASGEQSKISPPVAPAGTLPSSFGNSSVPRGSPEGTGALPENIPPPPNSTTTTKIAKLPNCSNCKLDAAMRFCQSCIKPVCADCFEIVHTKCLNQTTPAPVSTLVTLAAAASVELTQESGHIPEPNHTVVAVLMAPPVTESNTLILQPVPMAMKSSAVLARPPYQTLDNRSSISNKSSLRGGGPVEVPPKKRAFSSRKSLVTSTPALPTPTAEVHQPHGSRPDSSLKHSEPTSSSQAQDSRSQNTLHQTALYASEKLSPEKQEGRDAAHTSVAPKEGALATPLMRAEERVVELLSLDELFSLTAVTWSKQSIHIDLVATTTSPLAFSDIVAYIGSDGDNAHDEHVCSFVDRALSSNAMASVWLCSTSVRMLSRALSLLNCNLEEASHINLTPIGHPIPLSSSGAPQCLLHVWLVVPSSFVPGQYRFNEHFSHFLNSPIGFAAQENAALPSLVSPNVWSRLLRGIDRSAQMSQPNTNSPDLVRSTAVVGWPDSTNLIYAMMTSVLNSLQTFKRISIVTYQPIGDVSKSLLACLRTHAAPEFLEALQRDQSIFGGAEAHKWLLEEHRKQYLG